MPQGVCGLSASSDFVSIVEPAGAGWVVTGKKSDAPVYGRVFDICIEWAFKR